MNTPDETYIALVAGQRCGTNALASQLQTGAEIHNWGEVFHTPLPLDQPIGPHDARGGNFFRFRHALIARQPELFAPTRENQRAIWDAFVAFLAERSRSRTPLIDLKYNSFHHLNALWYRIQDEPLLLILLRNRRVPTIHLSRTDRFARAISYVLAIQTQRWHWRKGDDARSATAVPLDPEKVLAFMSEFQEEERIYSAWLRKHPRCLWLRYEEVFDAEGRIAAPVRDTLSGFLGMEIAAGETPIVRPPVPVTELVANYEDIVAAVRAAGQAI